MHYSRRLTSRASIIVRGATGGLLLVLSACGGYGGSSYNGSGGGTGCGGAYGTGPCPSPTITLSSPGTTVDRTVTLSASAAAASGLSVMQVEFQVDGASVGTATTAPYSVSWDSTTVSDGDHTLTASVTDSQSQTTKSAALSIRVQNNLVLAVTMTPRQFFPAPNSTATGTASLTAKLATGALSGKVGLTGVTATAVTINEGFAGSVGPVLISLTANGTTANQWDIPANALLTADQVTALLQGKLYVKATSAANPNGELRGQITPVNVTVVFAPLEGGQEVPAVTTNAQGLAATTVDASTNTLTVHVNSTGVDDASVVEVDTAASGATGPRLVVLTQDSVKPGHWSTELATITAADVVNFNANKWYVNVITPAQPSGEIRGQIEASSGPPPAAPTLTQLTGTAFQVCGGCHTGGGSALPASMDLRPGHIYASIVGVASVEQANLLRVKPGDPDNSYVVRKLEGVATISGQRMPLGGPFLDQATIDRVRAWISAGAQNN